MFKKALFASAAVMAAGVASAEVTGNFAVTSDYIFRGVASSGGAVAVQGGLDYSHDSGLYAGVWGSNAGVAGGTEIDYYVGYGLGISEGLSLDFGLINYNADGANAGGSTINELYVGIAGEAWDATVYIGDRDDVATGNDDADQYTYIDLNYGISTGETTSVDLHVGLLNEKADTGNFQDATDYSVTFNVGDFSMGVVYLDSDNAGATNNEKGQLVLGWGTEFDVK